MHNENMEIREYPYLALYSLYCISKVVDTTNDWRWTDCKLTSQKNQNSEKMKPILILEDELIYTEAN